MTDNPVLAPVKLVLCISGCLFFVFLVLSAASYKKTNTDQIGMLSFDGKTRDKSYDYAVNVFGFGAFGFLMTSLIERDWFDQLNAIIFSRQMLPGWTALFFALLIYIFIKISVLLGIRLYLLLKTRKFHIHLDAYKDHLPSKGDHTHMLYMILCGAVCGAIIYVAVWFTYSLVR